MATCSCNGVELYYEVHGQGKPLLLIAGLASDSQSWLTVLSGLSSRYQVIIVDNRGVGRTTPQSIPISIPAMADDCLALIHYLGLGAAHVLGHSMGGFVAQDLAIRHPQCVDRLILAGTSSFCSQRNKALLQDWTEIRESGLALEPWFRYLLYWALSPHFFETPATIDAAVREAVDYPYPQSPAALRGQVRAIVEYDGTARLSGIKAKTLVLAAQDDLLFPPLVCAQLAQHIPGASFANIEGVAHAMAVENPRAFMEKVFDFLT